MRRGDWLQTVSGRAFYPLDPRPEDIDIGDIAHALSQVCRFGGHCLRAYSVAEHSVRVAQAIRDYGGSHDTQFEGLLHDAAEAYIGDVIWPLKQAEELGGYKRIERAIEHAIADRFGLPRRKSPIVKHFDLVLLSTEKRDLMSAGPGREDGAEREGAAAREHLDAWHSDGWQPLAERIEPWPATEARRRFLDLYAELAR